MTRYREISSAEMTSAQKEVHDEIVAGRRGRFGGPFHILIRAPEVCRHLQRLGEYLRWGSSLAPALSELAICLTARHLRASYEWHAHAPLAVEAGVPAAAIEAIRTGTTPSFTATDQVLVHRVITELIDTKRLSDATFAEAIARLGEQGVVELGTIVGYYTAIGNALNIFQVPAAGGRPATLPVNGPRRSHGSAVGLGQGTSTAGGRCGQDRGRTQISVLRRINDHLAARLAELLSWNWKDPHAKLTA